MCDRRRNLHDIVRQIGISFGAVQSILIHILGMSKVSATSVSRMLTKEQKKSRFDISKCFLSLCEDDPEEFMHWVVTQDETRPSLWSWGQKAVSMQWKHPGSLPPRKFKRVASAGKVMASIFWNNQGIIMVGYLEEGHTINGAYYAEELRWLHQEIETKRRVVMVAATKCSFEVLPHPM